MTKDEAIVGTQVKSLVPFFNIPKGSIGIIDEDYHYGVMVAWDIPKGILKRTPRFDLKDPKTWGIRTGVIRDGFDKETELQFLEVI
jgi:hypothetical protein